LVSVPVEAGIADRCAAAAATMILSLAVCRSKCSACS
jgi:hypothetical protein